MHGGGPSGLGGFDGFGGVGGVPRLEGELPPGAAPDGPRRGRWFGDEGPLRGRRGTAILLGVLVLLVLLFALTVAL